jgi:hypothetical protein
METSRMSLGGTSQLDHAPRPLSTDAASASEHSNQVRLESGARGHVESHFLKANSPDGERAIWLKHTLLVPLHGPAVAEVWAIAFADRGRRKQARKQTFPLAEATFGATPFRLAVPVAELRQGAARGELGSQTEALRWQLRFDASGPAFLPFPRARMYSGSFPRNKTLTPVPDTRVFGSVFALGEHWQLDGWRGAQGHNWGKSHAEAYAWVHANALCREHEREPLAHSWVEALSGRVRIGPLVLPWLNVAGIMLEGRLFRFDGVPALLSRKVSVDARTYRFALAQGGVQLQAELSAEAEQLAGLRYEDPDGRALSCLNSKLATGLFRLTFEGRTHVLRTDQAALELGTRRPDHGIEILA